MIDVKVSYTGEELEAISFDRGQFTFGSGLDNDIVSFQEGIAPQHLKIVYDGRTIVVENLSAGPLSVMTGPNRTRKIQPQKKLRLKIDAAIIISDVKIRITGLRSFDRSERNRMNSTSNFKRSLVCVGMVATVFYTSYVTVASGLAQNVQVMEDTAPVMESTLSAEEIKSILSDEGMLVANWLEMEGGYSFDIYVGSDSRQALAAKLISGISNLKRTEIYSDSSIQRGIEISLRAARRQFETVDVHGGNAIIRGVPMDNDWEDMMANDLVDTVSGLRSVESEYSPAAWRSAIKDEVAAIWTGADPYIILTDYRKIRPGGRFGKDLVLVEVGSEGVLTIRFQNENYVIKIHESET